MKLTHLAGTVIALGLFFLLLAGLWSLVFSDKAVWTEPQAKEYQEAAASLHAAAHQRADAGKPPHANEPAHNSTVSYDEAKARYEKSQAALDSARSFQSRPAAIFRWIGGILCTLGLVGYFVGRSQ